MRGDDEATNTHTLWRQSKSKVTPITDYTAYDINIPSPSILSGAPFKGNCVACNVLVLQK